MCLTTTQTDWLIAKKDIKCYKILERCHNSYNGRTYYKTPYTNVEVSDSILKGEEMFKAEGTPAFRDHYYGCGIYLHQIDKGAIHAYKTMNRANDYASYNCFRVVFKCVIPKGTKYAVGMYDDICAEQIKFVKKLK